MSKKYDIALRSSSYRIEGRYNEMLGELASGNHGSPAEAGEVVAIGVADFSDETVQSQSPEQTGDLTAGFLRQDIMQPAAAESVEGKLAPDQGEEELEVFREEEVEAAPAAILLIAGRAADLVEVVPLGAVLFQSADEVEIAPACRGEQLVQVGQAVDRLFERRHFVFRAAIEMVHLAVVTKESDVIGGGLDPQHPAVFVVHLQRLIAQPVLDAGARVERLKLAGGRLSQNRAMSSTLTVSSACRLISS